MIENDVAKAAKSVAFQWPGIVEADDMEQSIWEHILESPSTMAALQRMENTPRYQTISKIGHRIASKERDDYDHFTGNFRYSVGEVKKLLGDGGLASKSSWKTDEYTTDGGEFEDVVLLTVSMAEDLKRGMEKLQESSPQYHDILVRKYRDGEYVTGTGAEHTRLTRAQTALTTAMNHGHKQQHAERPDGPGTRTVIKRSAAQSISGNQ